ncbi:hypothetical protein Efla_002605 [Eimeria flavescens]
MAPSAGFRPSREANGGALLSQAYLSRRYFVTPLVCVVLLCYLSTNAFLGASTQADAAGRALPPLPGVAPPFHLRYVDGGADPLSDPLFGSASPQQIHYEGCGSPLAVGGEVVRCEAAAENSKDSSKPAGQSRVANLKAPPGPLLNQLFSVEVSADWVPPFTGWQRDVAGGRAAGGGPEGVTAAGGGEEAAATDAWQGVKAVSEDPHFVRVFGRWIPQARGLHMWLDTEVIPAPLRRLASSATAEAAGGKPQSVVSPPHQSQGQRHPQKSREGRVLPRGRSPFLYWRQSAISLSVQNLCIALIKRPTGLAGSSAVGSFNPLATTRIPDSCEEAQSLSVKAAASAEDPVWLSCGPQMELSRLTHFLTFALSQAKLNRLLAALDYSVEVWREPRDGGQQQPLAKPAVSEPHLPAEQVISDERIQNQADQTQQTPTLSGEQQSSLPARDVEARRLAAQQSITCAYDAASEAPKWRVGVCLLRASQGAVAAAGSEPAGLKAAPQPPAGEALFAAAPFAHAAAADAAGSEEGKVRTSGTAVHGLQAVRTGESSNGLPSVSGTAEAQLVGELRFHVSPEITSHADDEGKEAEPETIQIRHFIDAEGTNLTRFNRLSLKAATEGLARPCTGFWEQHSLLGVAPETFARDAATNRETLKFTFSNALQEGIEESEALYSSVPGHHATSKMHVCFYANDEQPYGLLLGEVQFVIDSADATLLVFFILFVFLAIPVTCAVAISFHIYKHRHLRERLQRLVLVQQRDAVEQLLMRELGLTAEDCEEAEDDDEEEEAHSCSA